MSRHIQGFLILLLLFAIFGCGSGATSGDPLGTDSISVAASVTSVSAGQKSVITATVARLDKSPATDRSVTFSFHTNHTGGTLSVATVKVDGQSKALAVYTAGSDSPGDDVTDTIQVKLSNDAVAFVVITRKAETPPPPLSIVEIKAEPASLSAGQVSVITATVTSTSGSTSTPAAGVTVTFSLPVNNSGAILSSPAAITDGTGKAVVIYQPGGNSPMIDVQDTAQASIADGSIRAVVITRTAGIAPTVAVVAIEAAPKTLTANQSSVITATVTDNKGKPLSGETVIFSIPVRNTGSPQLTNYSGVSDGNGIVTTVYSPGTLLPANTVDDTVQASLVNGSSRAVVITRSGGTPISISVAAAPTSVKAGEASVITATLTGDDKSGVTVTFSLPVNNSGATLSAFSAITDGAGKAQVTYQAGNSSPTIDVSDTVRASYGSISSSVAITRTGTGTPTPLAISVAAAPNSVSAWGVSVITATLTGDNKAGVTVTFSFLINDSGAALSSMTAVTDGSGKATVSYQAGSDYPTFSVQDVVQAAVGIATSAVVITRTGAGPPTPLAISVAAAPTSVNAGQASIVTATLTGDNNVGVAVKFSLPIYPSGATLSASSAITDGSGKAVVTYRAGLNDPTLTVSDVVQAAVGSISSSVVITRTTGGGTGGADSISSLIASKTEVSSGVMSVITATVRCERAASGESVSQTISFTIPLNKSEASFIDSSGASVSTITKTMQLGVLSTEISVTYSAGNKDSYKQVEDIVQATLGNGSTQSIIITRTGSTTGGYTISLTANPTTLASRTGTSAITATVKDSSGINASGMPVHFSNTGSGTLDTMDRTTNTGGLATVTFTSTATAAGTAIVSACVDLDRSGGCAASEPNAAVVVTIP
jgi:hypothetical protein